MLQVYIGTFLQVLTVETVYGYSPPLKGMVILNRLKCDIQNTIIAIKLSYRDISKCCTYCPGLIQILPLAFTEAE